MALHNGIFAHFETTGPVAGCSLGVHLRPISSFHLIESYRCGHVSLLPAALTRSSLFRPLDCLFSGGRGPGRAVAKGNIATGQFMCRKSRENWQWPFVFFFGQEEARPFSDVCLSRNGGTIFLNIFSSLPVNFSFGEYSCDREV